MKTNRITWDDISFDISLCKLLNKESKYSALMDMIYQIFCGLDNMEFTKNQYYMYIPSTNILSIYTNTLVLLSEIMDIYNMVSLLKNMLSDMFDIPNLYVFEIMI
jgi:hypothetical protein